MIMNVMLEVMRMSINKVSAVLDHFFSSHDYDDGDNAMDTG